MQNKSINFLTALSLLIKLPRILFKIGIKNIMPAYGIIFLVAYLIYGLAPSITAVAFVTVLCRVFEYGLNKPSREMIYSVFNKNNRYKSSVLIDTFVTRFGDLTGSALIKLAGVTSIATNALPLMALPIAGYLSYLGIKISNKDKIKDL